MDEENWDNNVNDYDNDNGNDDDADDGISFGSTCVADTNVQLKVNYIDPLTYSPIHSGCQTYFHFWVWFSD